ncbi:phage tail protein (plasmid) [Halobacteriovorax sp. GFR7]|uniref:phage tail protein n=1 Tax=unclassified Halobacteriovorax TaxID=2639665 RepID=UPI003D9927DA
MAFIINLIIQIIIALVISLIFSKPVDSHTKPAGIADFKFPTATQARPIPVLWGTAEFKAPNCTWAGDFYVQPVKKKVRSGFTKKSITVGYRYHMGMQLVLCLGGTRATQQMTALTRLRYGDKVAWEGLVSDQELQLVDNNNLYGGNERGGGIYGYFRFYNGSDDQTSDPYLDRQIGAEQPNRAGVAHVVWYGASLREDVQLGNFNLFLPVPTGYVANSTNLRTMWFTGTRLPNTLNLTGGMHDITGDCNPACMIHELLTEPDWGMGWSEDSFEVDDLRAMGETLYDEGFGLSMLWDNEKTIKDVLDDIMQHISGYYYEDKISGKIRFGLMRSDYDTETLDLLESPTVIEVEEFTRSTWDGSMNEITVAYSDPARYFELNTVTVNDIGNVYVQNKVVPRTNQYHGITSKSIAIRVGFRDLRMLSIPLVRTTLKCTRDISTWQVGRVFKWSDPRYGIEEMVMRVNKVERGDYLSGEVILHAVEDVFTRGETIFAVPDDNNWTPPNFDAVELDDLVNIETPIGLSLYPEDATPELLTLVYNTSPINAEYNAFFGNVTGVLSDDEAESETFTDSAVIVSSLRVNDPSYSATSNLIVRGLLEVPEAGAGASQEALIYVGGEFIGYDSYSLNADGDYVFLGLHRGLLNTTMVDAQAGSRVALLNGGGFIPPVTYNVGETLYYKLQPLGVGASLDLDDITEQSHLFYGEKARPYVLTDMKVNGVYDFTNLDTDVDLTVTWGNNPKELGIAVDSNDTSQALQVDTDYTISVYSPDGLLLTNNVSALTGATALNTTTFTYADLYGAGVQADPYGWVTITSTDVSAAEDSTYTAVKVFSRLEGTVERDVESDPLAPTGAMVYFDGKMIGIRHGA